MKHIVLCKDEDLDDEIIQICKTHQTVCVKGYPFSCSHHSTQRIWDQLTRTSEKNDIVTRNQERLRLADGRSVFIFPDTVDTLRGFSETDVMVHVVDFSQHKL